jgi:RimJ/RimL family protein N-acetyltransferase
VIETERLLLRQPVPDDVPSIAEAMADPEVMRYISGGKTGSFADAVAQVEKMRRAWREDGFGRFVVVRKADGAAVGRVGLLAWDPDTWQNGTRAEIGDHAEIELGWTLVRSAWGSGYASEAAFAVRDWALAEVAPPRLISLIHADNERSLRVAAKLGEHYERPITIHRGLDVQLWAT